MRHALGLTVVLIAVWLAWSGHYTPLFLFFAAVSVALVIIISRRMGIDDEEGAPIDIALGLARYLPWLAWEIAKANVDVARRILNPSLPISPRVIRVGTGQRTDVGRVLYANSITLTPGTVTVWTEGDELVVHALTRAAAEGVQSGEMDRRACRVEGRADGLPEGGA